MKTNFTIAQIKSSACAKRNQHLFEEDEDKKKKRPKYNNEPVEFDGKKFDSTKERDRYILLRYREGMQEIKELTCQVRFLLESNDEKICDYIADFTYTEIKTGKFIVEDVKSAATRRLRPYRIKKRLMEVQYKIIIKEV